MVAPRCAAGGSRLFGVGIIRRRVGELLFPEGSSGEGGTIVGWQVSGPLAPYAEGFHLELRRLGYTPVSAGFQMQLMSHASRWAAEQGLQPGDLVPEVIDRFLALRRAQGRKEWISPIGMKPLLGYLRGIGVVPEPERELPATNLERLTESYRVYLTNERGLTPETITAYVTVAHLFLSQPTMAGRASLADLSGGEVLAFVTRELRSRPPGSAPAIATGMRALLRYLFLDGKIGQPLALVVPKVARWRLRALPPSLDPGQVNLLLRSCDQAAPVGLRDSAILTMLVRLGVRAGEVAALRLDDIDWRRGELTIHGKGRRQEQLPLPTDVGEALVAWLRRARPSDADVHVFTRIRAPHVQLTSSGVSHIVEAACRRAGLEPFHAHRLRHVAATEMLRSGASLIEIGQVLRHSRSLTTAIYAKVDHASLSTLALPWPEVLP